MKPVVSVIVLARDCEAHVTATLGSVLRQTHAQLEVVVWDDGSADGTVERALSAAAGDPRVRIISKPRMGTLVSLQQALQLASGPYFCWIPGADAITPDAIARTVAALQRFEAAGMVYSQYAWVEPDGVIGKVGTDCKIPYSKERLLTSFMTTQLRLFRRTAFDAVGGFDAALQDAHDYDLCLKLSEHGLILHIPHVLYFRRRRFTDPIGDQRVHLERMRAAIEQALARRGLAERFEAELEVVARFRLHRTPSSR